MKKILLVTCLFVAACASMTVSEKETKRNELDKMAAKAIAGLVEKDAAIQQELDESLAYAVANMKLTKVPIVGAGGGEGVVFIKATQKKIYFTVSRFDLGGGWGARSYKALMLFNTQEVLDNWQGGKWEFQAGAEASAGTASAEGSSGGLVQGFTMHVLSDGGASATVTARMIRVKVNHELTDN